MNLSELRQAIESLPMPRYKGKSNIWLGHRMKLRECILNPTKGDIKSYPAWFMYWPTIQATMYIGQAPYIQLELDEVLQLYDSNICEPGKFFHEPTEWNGLSTNLIHQAYHLVQFETRLGIRIRELDTIIEFGGGYGAMALVAFRMGFEGDYYIYDFPEFSILQRYYLSHQPEVGNVYWNEYLKDYDLCIAIHSLSEVDNIDARWEFLIRYPAMSYLFAYSRMQNEIDNHAWFGDLQETNMDWLNWQIEHLPGKFYLVGAE